MVCLRSSFVMNGIWLASQLNCSGVSCTCLESLTYTTGHPCHFHAGMSDHLESGTNCGGGMGKWH